MSRSITWLAMLPALAASAVPVAAQEPGDELARSAPRFMVAMGGASPMPVDVSRTAVLQRRISVNLSDVTLEDALATVAREAGLHLLYSRAVVPLDRYVRLRAEDISVAGALTELLLGAGVDVLFSSGRQAALVKRHEPAVPVVLTGSIAGRVTDAATNLGIQDVNVRLQDTGFGTATDAEGRYRLADVPVGNYTLVVERLGYGSESRSVTVAEGAEVTLDLALQLSPTALEEIVVTGTVVPTAVRALPTPVSVITAEDIEQYHVQRFDEMIRLAVPGATVWEYGGTSISLAQDISLRGKSSLEGVSQSNPKVYIDGVEVTFQTTAAVDPQSIERIEVIRGPQAAAIYGSDAMGGVIQVFTKRGSAAAQRPEIEAEAAFGVIESAFEGSGALRQEYRAAVHGRSGAASYRLGGGFRHTGEWMPEFGETTPSLHGALRVEQGPLSIDLSARLLQNNWDAPFDPRFVETGASFFSDIPSFQRTETRLETLGLRLDYQPTAWWQHAVTVGVDRNRNLQFQTRPRRTTPEDTLLSFLERPAEKLSVRYHTAVTAGLGSGVIATLTAGGDHYALERTSLRTEGALRTRPLELAEGQSFSGERSRITSGGVFGQLQLSFRDRLFLTGALRADAHSNFGEELGMPLSPRVGATYVRELGAITVKLRAAYGEAMRPPFEGAGEGFVSEFVVVLPNPELRPERQAGPDLGVDLIFGRRASLSVTYFDQTVKDFVQFVTLDLGSPQIFQNQNLARAKNTGWEIEGALDLGRVSLRGTFADTHSRPEDLGEFVGDETVGEQLLAQPRYTGALTLAATPISRTSVTAALTYQGSWRNYDLFAFYRCFGDTGPCLNEDFSLDEYIISFPGFSVLDLSIDRQLTNWLTGYVSVKDVMNRGLDRAVDAFRGVQGRVTTFGVRVRR